MRKYSAVLMIPRLAVVAPSVTNCVEVPFVAPCGPYVKPVGKLVNSSRYGWPAVVNALDHAPEALETT